MKRLVSDIAHMPRRWATLSLAICITLYFAVSSSNILGQSGAGSIQGTVTDSTGAVIPGASVHVVQLGTNAVSDARTNEVGFYQVPSLFTGTYSVTVSAPSMKTYKLTIELLVAQVAVINPVLTAGAVTQEVVVTFDPVQLTTNDSGTISATLENTRINQLPMNGRYILNLVGMVTPGLESTGMRAGGLMPEALEYVADGVPLTNRQFGGESNSNQAQLPDPDAVQEVRMLTANTSAQYATPATGVITTKSGNNSLHGSFFETTRNNAFGVARVRQNPSNYSAPHYIRNEFGASAGGPIILPKIYHGQNKSFWFFAYERYSNSQKTTELVKVPTQAMRGGDFSGLVNSSGVLQQLYDPSTTQSSANGWQRTAFVNNQIPVGRLAPATKILYDITPLPTTSDNPLVSTNFAAPNPTFTKVPTTTFRLDHTLNENNKVYLKYGDNYQFSDSLRNYPSSSPASIAADGFPAQATGYQLSPITQFDAAIGYSHIFSPTFYSETILSEEWFDQRTAGGGNPLLNYNQMLGLPDNFGEVGFPTIGSNLLMPYGGTEFGYGINQIIINIDENITRIIGRHQMQFGGRYRHEGFGLLPNEQSDSVSFSGLATGNYNPSSGANYSSQPNTGYQDADFFLGAASNYGVTLQGPFQHYHDMEFDGYLQDNIHVTKNFSANIGVRYEAHPAYYTKDGLAIGFDLKNKAIVMAQPTSFYVNKGYTTQAVITNLTNLGAVFETASQAGYPDTILKNSNLNLMPRVGFAYQLFNGKYGTVIRGAYGRYLYPAPVGSSIKNSYGDVPFVAAYNQSYTAANQSPDGLANYLLRSPQTVIMGKNSAGVVNSTTINAIQPGINLTVDNPDYPQDLATQANLTVEQPLKGNTALRLTWQWTHGSNLDEYYDFNSAPSSYVWEMANGVTPPSGSYTSVPLPYDSKLYGSGMVWDQKSGWSNDNALQASYQRLFHRGIAYQVNYVWSKPFRVAGNTYRDGVVYPWADYANANPAVASMTPYGTLVPAPQPAPPPQGAASYAYYKKLNAFQNYKVDTAIPKQHITFNGVIDLPIGRGQRLLGNSNRVIDEIVGGWQIAGDGNIISQDFAASGNWGPTNPIHIYKHRQKITDCRSGVCHESFLWFNGYISPLVINAAKNGVSGLPSGYAANQAASPAFSAPMNNTPGTPYFGSNEVAITLSNGKSTDVGYSPGPSTNLFNKTILNGPINYTVDLSVFKMFPISEKTNLRFNVDAFNALNVQGYLNPNATDGTESLLSSANSGRVIQMTLRFTF